MFPDSVKADISNEKTKGNMVYSIELNKMVYVYRSINRKEYRLIQQALATRVTDNKEEVLRDDGEEDLVFKALLNPKFLSKTELSSLPAGIVTKLAELIMKASGFGDLGENQPVEL